LKFKSITKGTTDRLTWVGAKESLVKILAHLKQGSHSFCVEVLKRMKQTLLEAQRTQGIKSFSAKIISFNSIFFLNTEHQYIMDALA